MLVNINFSYIYFLFYIYIAICATVSIISTTSQYAETFLLVCHTYAVKISGVVVPREVSIVLIFALIIF